MYTVQHLQGACCWTSPLQGTLAQPQMAENQSQTRHILRGGGLSGLVILLAEQYQPLTPLDS